ncbi:ATP-binding protein [Halobaculum sp. EA56]|uniref:ATP-binding protein n=1 Tax=Halobaculum sp. EA56 TaxID=3421648 RepID=UPI003EC0465D
MTHGTTHPIRVGLSGGGDAFSTGFRSFLDTDDGRIDANVVTGSERLGDLVAAGAVDCVVHAVDLPGSDSRGESVAVGETDPAVPVVAVAPEGVPVTGADAVVVAGATEEGYRRVAAHVRAAVDASRGGSVPGRDLYETVLESIDDAVYAIRADGTIVYVNDRYARMKGTDRAALIGTDIYELVTDETAERARRERQALERRESDVGVVEYEFTPVDGEPFPAEMRFSVVGGDGEVDRVGVIRDISARQEREEILRRKNRRLEEFTGIVSHDLRSPLNVATGRLALAREECDSDHLDDVERALDRMESLIEGLLTLATEGEDVGDPERVGLPTAVRECLGSVDLPSEQVRIETGRTVRADRDRLRQLLENLLRNAVDHAGDDVTVTVGDLPGGFYVEDDGPGIDPDDRDGVFDVGVSTADDGTGFGLAIVSQIVGAHGWSIDVTTGTEGGARFEVTGVDRE